MTAVDRGTGPTPVKRFRIPTEIWDQVQALRINNMTSTDVVVEALRLGLKTMAKRKAYRKAAP